MTHLHLKWRVHSILPLAPRAKQPALHIHFYDTRYSEETSDRLSYQYEHTVHWAVELARFQLAAGGGERSGPNMLLWLLFSFMLGLRRVGGNIASCESVRNVSYVIGHYVNQQCQLRIGCYVKPCA